MIVFGILILSVLFLGLLLDITNYEILICVIRGMPCAMKELLVEDELELSSEEDEKDDEGEFVRM